MDELRRETFDLCRDMAYYLTWPFPNDKTAMQSTCYTFNHISQKVHTRIWAMANKKKGAETNYAPPTDLKWINRNLTDDEKAHHDAQAKKQGELGVLLFKVAMQGYNVRIAWDAYSSCFQANLVPFQPENPNFGYAISARGITPERAVSLLLYKHYAIFEEQWSDFYQAKVSTLEG